ncbi:MAG: pilus assembly protein [Pseudolabrys sp.]|nr:pilus assembly protein [Pseudolabrys sp.]
MHDFSSKLLGLARAFAGFGRARDGAVVIIFALAIIPVLGLVGAAVDFSRANSLKATMQNALDATALMLSKTAASQTSAQLQVAAQSYFMAQFTRPEARNASVTASYSKSGGSTVVVNGSADIDTEFMGILGLKSINITGTSTSKWGSARLRVALVLDTTGSMSSDNKMTALKTATKNLLTQMQAAASADGDVYVSIIPFSKNVNLNPSNYNATYLSWVDWEAEPAYMATWLANSTNNNTWKATGPGDTCPFTTSSHGFRCTTGPANDSANTNTVPSSGTFAGYICPGVDGGNRNALKIGLHYNGCYNSVPTTTTTSTTVSTGWNASCGSRTNCSCSGSGSSRKCVQTTTTTGEPYTHVWRPAGTAAVLAKSAWNGCITDRGTTAAPSQNYDRLVTAPISSIDASKFPAEQNSYCSPAITGLSYNWTAMKTQVDNLYPLGATGQPIGLVWGWQSLVGGGPLTAPAKDPNYTYTDVIILLTDGLNTQNRWYGNGSSTSTQVDDRMYDSTGQGTCANINAAKITVYAIQVNTGGDATSTLLQKCAGSPGKFPDPEKFFLLTSANDIITTFDAIGTNLTRLRIAQ